MDKFYSSRPWRQFRAAFLQQFPRCVMCGAPATVVDHIQRRSAGGASLDPGNCQSCCAPCHNRKTRLHDQRRRSGPYIASTPGCDASGLPTDPAHHWRKP